MNGHVETNKVFNSSASLSSANFHISKNKDRYSLLSIFVTKQPPEGGIWKLDKLQFRQLQKTKQGQSYLGL